MEPLAYFQSHGSFNDEIPEATLASLTLRKSATGLMSSNCDSLYIQAFVIENSHNQVRQRYGFEVDMKYMQIAQFHIVVNIYLVVAVMD